jgi:GAF domain-containing protein
MDTPDPPLPSDSDLLIVDNWPMSLEATRKELQKAQARLAQYRAALRLAGAEIERRNQGLLALTTFSYQASRVAHPIALLKLALVQAMETIKAPSGAITLIEEETKELSLGVYKGLTPELHTILVGRELGQGAAALMPHLVAGSGALLEYETSDDEQERQLLAASHLTSLVSLPLQFGSRLLGSLLIGLQGKRTFTPTELCFLMALSQATAITLEGLRVREGLWRTAEILLGSSTTGLELHDQPEVDLNLDISTPFELPVGPSTLPQPAADDLEQLLAAMMEAEDEVQQQNLDLQTLNTIAEMMNQTLNLKEILQCAVNQTQTTLNTDAAWLYLVDEKNLLDLQTHVGLSLDYVIGMHNLKFGEGLEGQVAAHHKAQFVDAIAADPRLHKIWVDKEGLQAIAATPITRPDPGGSNHPDAARVIGVLAAGKRTAPGHTWSPREIRLLTSIANQVALAIDNARLYAQVQENEAAMRTGNEVLRTLNEMLLEKNVSLETLVQDNISPALTTASNVLKHLLIENPSGLNESQKQDINNLQKIIQHLRKLTQDAAEGNVATPSPSVPANDPTPDSAPILHSPIAEPVNPETPPVATSGAMSFEEAVAAGLVPAHILKRENR